MREEVGAGEGKIDNGLLLDLLGLSELDLAGAEIPGRAGIGIPQQAGTHNIMIARVVGIRRRTDGNALLYMDRAYMQPASFANGGFGG